MMAPLVLAAIAAAVPPPAAADQGCRLIAVNGAVIGFTVESAGPDGQIRLIPAAGSVWPADQSGAAALKPDRSDGSRIFYSVGAGSDAKVLNLAPNFQGWLSADLFEKKGSEAGLLYAQGFCRAPAGSVAAVRPGETLSLLPSTTTAITCGVLAIDGRRSNVRFGVDGNSATIVPVDGEIWPKGTPITVSRMSPPMPPGRNGILVGFATELAKPGESRPSFHEIAYIDQAAGRITVELTFHSLAGRTGASNDAGFAICDIKGQLT